MNTTTKTCRSLPLTLLLALTASPSAGPAQTTACGYPSDGRVLWRGSFSYTVSSASSPPNCSCSASTFASGSFEYIYSPSGLSKMNPSGVSASVSWIDHCSCNSDPGSYGVTRLGSSPNTSIDSGPLVVINSDCTYSLVMTMFVDGNETTEICGLAPITVPNHGLPSSGYLQNLQVPVVTHLALPQYGQPLVGNNVTYTAPSGLYCPNGPERYTVSWNIVPLRLKMTSVETPTPRIGDLNTFVSTDTITLKATLTPPEANAEVKWTVRGISGGAISEGLPSQEVHPTDSQGVSTFTFSPNSTAFRILRGLLWTGGSLTANPPIAFEVTAELARDGVTLKSRLSEQSALGKLEQDEIDTLRQEYVDYDYSVPARWEFQSAPSYVNSGNYAYGLNLMGSDNHYQTILEAYRRITIIVNGNNVALPLSAGLEVKLGYINPQKYKAIAAGPCAGSNDSHRWGKALDLVPDPVEVVIGQDRVQLDKHKYLYLHLFQVGAFAGTPTARAGCNFVQPGDTSESHVDVFW